MLGYGQVIMKMSMLTNTEIITLRPWFVFYQADEDWKVMAVFLIELFRPASALSAHKQRLGYCIQLLAAVLSVFVLGVRPDKTGKSS